MLLRGLFTNGLLIVDAFAEAGYLTLALDYFRDDPVWKHRKDRHDRTDPDFDYEAWKKKHTADADEYVTKWVARVKAQYGSEKTKYACVGYVAIDLRAKQEVLIGDQILLWSAVCVRRACW